MKVTRISRSISMVLQTKLLLLILSLFCAHNLMAQDGTTMIVNPRDTIKPTKYVAPVIAQRKQEFFQGFTLSADIFGPILYTMSDYGSVEAGLLLNLKNTYFPTVEIGYGKCNTTDGNTNIHYVASSPFVRIGLDFNILKDKFQDNRFYVGARYGFSTFTYDISGPDMTDPVWGGIKPFDYKGLNSNSHWTEIVFGVQIKIWKKLHMGWSVRYKQELKIGQSDYAKPYYIPGYGTTTSTSCWGGTYNLIFDLNWGRKKTVKEEKKNEAKKEEKSEGVKINDAGN